MEQDKMEASELRRLSHQQSSKPGEVQDLTHPAGHDLQRRLETRHVTMIALGGALGTGLMIGT